MLQKLKPRRKPIMPNEFEKRMRKDLERRLDKNNWDQAISGRIKDSFKPIVIGRVPIKEETVDVDISRTHDTSHRTYKNKIEEAIALAKKKLGK